MSRRVTATAFALALVAGVAAAISPDIERALRESRYVYIQSERKSGEFGKPAEIWFMYEDGAVWVGTRPTSWRVRRIKAGRPKARIAVGTANGPGFAARGELRQDAAMQAKMLAEFARKYPEGWPKYAASFTEGFKSGERVLVRYLPQ